MIGRLMPDEATMSWGEICRLCLKQGLQTYNIYSDSSQDSAVTMTIRVKWVTELDVTEGDGLPNQVCVPCVQKLNAGYEFKRQCLISDKTLRKFMSQTNNNNNLSPVPSSCTPENSQETITPSNSKESDAEPESPELVGVKEEVIIVSDNKVEPAAATVQEVDDTMSVRNADLGNKVETVYRDSTDSDSALDLSLEAQTSSEGSEMPTEAQPMVLIPGQASKVEKVPTVKKKGRPLKCEYCEKKFIRLKSMENHVKQLHGSVAIKKEYKCKMCDLSFHCLSLYDRHLRVHTGKKPFCCVLCTQSFSTQGSLTVHIKSHTGQKDFKCNVCGKCFTVKGSLTTHLRTHTQEKPYHCSACPKSFSVQRDLVRHSKCHTGEKNYKCDSCDKMFSRRDSLTSHVRIHQGIKPFLCSICKKSYPTQSNLKKHMKKQHSGGIVQIYKCNDCSKEFTDPTQLQQHARVHETTTTAPSVTFKCPSCPKTFPKQALLTKHFLTHKEDFPFACSLCDRSFPTQVILTRHLKKHVENKK